MSFYLIAILPPQDIHVQIKHWKDYMLQQYNCQVALKSPAHITLIPPFHLNDKQIPALQSLLIEVAAGKKPFTIELKDFAVFPPRVIFVHVLENFTLAALRKKLEDLLLSRNYPVKKEERVFHPHITIANRDLEKENFSDAWAYFKRLSYTAAFPANAIHLLKHNGKTWDTVYEAMLPQI